MLRIRLITRDDHLVGLFEIVPFLSPPEVVIWGDRIFELDSEHLDGSDDGAQWQYREVFAYCIVDGMQLPTTTETTTEMEEE